MYQLWQNLCLLGGTMCLLFLLWRFRATESNLLVLFILIFASLECSAQNSIDEEINIEKLLREGYKSTALDKEKEVVIILGNTGTGKSTFSKFLRRDPTLKIERTIDGIWIFTDNETKIGSDSFYSKTLYPNVDVDKKTGVQVVDCAGFENTRSNEMDLLAAFFNKKIVDSSKTFKIVIVENFSNLQKNGNRDSFARALRHTAKLIGTNFDSFNGSIGLVATKVDDRGEKSLTRVSAFLGELLKHLKGKKASAAKNGKEKEADELLRQISLLQFLIQGENIQLFWKPQNSRMESIEGNRLQLRKLVFEILELALPFKHEFQVTIAAETVNYVKETLLKNSEKTIEDELQKLSEELLRKFNESTTIEFNIRPIQRKAIKVIEFCISYLNILDRFDNISEQMEIFARKRGVSQSYLLELHTVINISKFFRRIVGKDVDEVERSFILNLKSSLMKRINAEVDFYSFLQHLIRDFASYEVQTFQAQIVQQMENLKMISFHVFADNLSKWGFSMETNHTAYNLSPSEIHVGEIRGLASELKENKVEVEKKSNSTVIISSRFVILSKLRKQIEEMTVGEIVLIAGEKLFIDCNLTLQNAHLKLVAPFVEIVGNMTRRIILFGEDGAKKDKAASCGEVIEMAADGADGNDGFSSGNFTLLALDLRNGHLLEVHLEGGNGGDGQDGGDSYDYSCARIYDRLPNEIVISGVDFEGMCLHPSFRIGYVGCWIMVMYRDDGTDDKDYYLEVAKMISNAGYGGFGGAGAVAGAHRIILKNSNVSKNIKINSTNGHHGVSGMHGMANEYCTHKGRYDCNCWLEISEIYCKKKDFRHWNTCSSEPPPIDENYQQRKFIGSEAVNRQKFGEGKLLELAFQYYKVISTQNLTLHADTDEMQFLHFLFIDSSDEMFSQLTALDFLNMIEDAEESAQSKSQGDTYGTFQRMFSFYSAMLKSVRKWKRVQNIESYQAADVEFTLVNLLDTLQVFLHGKQLVELSKSVDLQLKRLEEVENAIEKVGKFEAVAAEKNMLQTKITNAKTLMNRVYNRNIEKLGKKQDDEFNNLLIKTNQMKQKYRETDKILVEHEKKLKVNMWKNVVLGIVNVVSVVASALYPPAAAVGPTISGIVQAVAPGPGELDYKSQMQEAVKNAKQVFQKFQDKKENKWKNMITFVKSITESNVEVQFLKEENKQRLENLLVKEPTEVDYAASVNILPLLNEVAEDLETRMASLPVGASTKKYKNLKKVVSKAKLVATTAVEVANAYQQYSSDKSKLDQVETAIQQNRANLQEMATYEENLHQTFKPMLEQMMNNFNTSKSNMEGQNSFELLFERMDLKSYARKCASLMQELTQDFFTVDKGFVPIVNELQELMNTLIDAYDKIEELLYRVQLAEFVGKLSGVNCISDPNPNHCISKQKVAKSIKTNQLVREFVQVFAAYQQVSFPFGADKMTLLNATHLSLHSAPKERVVELLRSALKTIQDDLSASAVSTLEHDVVHNDAKFSSNFKTTRPFYLWPNAQFSKQIGNLLRGKRVSLMAFASAPGVRNAVKANWVELNITSREENVAKQLKEVLEHFHIEMVRSGESYFRCGSAIYAFGGANLTLKVSFERDEKGHFVTQNKVHGKVSKGDVPLSPYAMWIFKLVPASQENTKDLLQKLAKFSNKVDLELVGEGSYIDDGVAICSSDLSRAYNYVGLRSFSNEGK